MLAKSCFDSLLLVLVKLGAPAPDAAVQGLLRNARLAGKRCEIQQGAHPAERVEAHVHNILFKMGNKKSKGRGGSKIRLRTSTRPQIQTGRDQLEPPRPALLRFPNCAGQLRFIIKGSRTSKALAHQRLSQATPSLSPSSRCGSRPGPPAAS